MVMFPVGGLLRTEGFGGVGVVLVRGQLVAAQQRHVVPRALPLPVLEYLCQEKDQSLSILKFDKNPNLSSGPKHLHKSDQEFAQKIAARKRDDSLKKRRGV